MNTDNTEGMVYTISPQPTPFFAKSWKVARMELGPMGGSMRKQRRRKAKPIRFTPCAKKRRLYEWLRDSL